MKLSPQEQEVRWRQFLATKKTVAVKKNDRKPPKQKSNQISRPPKKSLSDCSVHYALALSDPWSCPEAPCVPDTITLESFKFSVRSRATFAVGTAGYGYVALNPYNPYAYSTGSANWACATTSAFTGPGYYLPNGSNGVNWINNDSGFSYVQANGYEHAYRVVGSGIKVMYTGNEMNRQGLFLIYRDPSNTALADGSTFDALATMREAAQVAVTKDWHCCLWKPASASDITYAPRGNDIDVGGGNKLYAQNPCMMIGIAGGTPGASIQFDLITWFELTGRSLPTLTVSHTDPVGFSLASSAVSAHQPEVTPQENAISFAKSMESHGENFSFIDTAGSIVSKVAPIVREVASLL